MAVLHNVFKKHSAIYLAASSLYEGVFAQIANQEDAGAVNIIYGSASGLTAVDNQIWSQDSARLAGLANDNELFGFAIKGSQAAAVPLLIGLARGM